MGTLQDLVHSLIFWRKSKTIQQQGRLFPANRNNNLRFILLAAVIGASLISIKYLGLLDPLVIFQRGSTTLAANFFSVRQPGIRATLGLVSLLFLAVLLLEFWQPRFWCRNLCPVGALISLVSRFSLFKRQVNATECTNCGKCQRTCPMNAIPKQVLRTDYFQCTFCLECSSSCPKDGIRFAFGSAPQKDIPSTQYQSQPASPLV